MSTVKKTNVLPPHRTLCVLQNEGFAPAALTLSFNGRTFWLRTPNGTTVEATVEEVAKYLYTFLPISETLRNIGRAEPAVEPVVAPAVEPVVEPAVEPEVEAPPVTDTKTPDGAEE